MQFSGKMEMPLVSWHNRWLQSRTVVWELRLFHPNWFKIAAQIKLNSSAWHGRVGQGIFPSPIALPQTEHPLLHFLIQLIDLLFSVTTLYNQFHFIADHRGSQWIYDCPQAQDGQEITSQCRYLSTKPSYTVTYSWSCYLWDNKTASTPARHIVF